MTDVRRDLKGLLPDEVETAIASIGGERYRSRQILSWMYAKGATSFIQMTDLSKAFRQKLEETCRMGCLSHTGRSAAQDGTVKHLLGLEDGLSIETVLISDGRRRTVCVSSQVGCPLQCKFCLTGAMGFWRNLTAGEIVEQVLVVRRELRERGEDVTNIVMMGMGEPLLNYDSVLKAVRIMQSELGMAFGPRRITISTAGLVPGIARLANEGLRLGLAISLNATRDSVRDELMPVNRKYPIAELIEAARDFYEKVGRRITFEYVLIENVTDSPDDAERLAKITRKVPSKVNLIPLNAGGSSGLRRSSRAATDTFHGILTDRNVTATLRESRGADILAACGQLGARSAWTDDAR